MADAKFTTTNANRYSLSTASFNVVKQKKALFNEWYRKLMNVCLCMFEYDNLPDTINHYDLDFKAFTNGFVWLDEIDSKHYALECALAGEPNVDYLPTLAVIANPALKITNPNRVIGKDGILLLSDPMFNGLKVYISKYAALLSTMEISFYWGGVSSRTQKMFEAKNDDVRKSIEDVFEHLEDGDALKAIASKPILKFMESYDFANNAASSSNLKALIETTQYLLASFYIGIGLNANYNMKKESLNENEINADNDVLMPFIDVMLKCRQEAWDAYNNLKGTNVKVRLGKQWQRIRESAEVILEEQKKQAEEPEANPEAQEEPKAEPKEDEENEN